jgi:hypothetical protein
MSVLSIHIISGLIGLVSGFIAVFAVKGMRLHRKSGIVFVYSMVVLGLTGAVLGVIKNEPGNVVAGALACYFVVTAFLTVRQGSTDLRSLAAVAMLVALAISGLLFHRAALAFNTPAGHINGVPWGMSFFMGFVILLAAAGDLRVLLRGPLQGSLRIARHLWRMCFALFVASGSFFLGQAQVFPKPMRIYPLLAIPALLPLVLLLYWLARVRFTQWYRRSIHLG